MSRIPVISAAEAEFAYAAAQCVVEIHRRTSDFMRLGQTLAQIDAFVAKQLADLKCTSCFVGYRVGRGPAFPSYSCLSVNECVVHGTAGYYTKPMVEGDVLKLDVGVWCKGWIGDAAWTYAFKSQSPQAKKLMDAGKDSLARGVKQLHPKNTYLNWAQEVQTCVEKEHGFKLIRGLGGHGIGRKLHGPPFVSNVVPKSHAEWPDATLKCMPGTLIAVEPMLSLTTGETSQKRNEWPVYTADGSLSVHYEHDVLITETGPRVLSDGMQTLPDVVG